MLLARTRGAHARKAAEEAEAAAAAEAATPAGAKRRVAAEAGSGAAPSAAKPAASPASPSKRRRARAGDVPASSPSHSPTRSPTLRPKGTRMLKDSRGRHVRDENGMLVAADVLRPGAKTASLQEQIEFVQREKRDAAAAGGVGLDVDAATQAACDAALLGAWVVGLPAKNPAIEREVERALGDPRERLLEEQASRADESNPSKAMHIRHPRAPNVGPRARPRGSAIERAVADGAVVDAAADAWFRASDALARLGAKGMNSRAAESRTRARAFRREQKASMAAGKRDTTMDHGVQMADPDLDEDELDDAAAHATGHASSSAPAGLQVPCCRRSGGPSGRGVQSPKKRARARARPAVGRIC